MDKKNKISCSCGSCELFLNDPLPKYSVMCACEDCRQALRWAEINGGEKPGDILYSVYSHNVIVLKSCSLNGFVEEEHRTEEHNHTNNYDPYVIGGDDTYCSNGTK